ncbi:MAG: Kae1-associated kinase Bud32 [Candidatus Bathyarchaeota archaeon]|nr:Kae1-associated kinase Bud32 [Candidatus Bathyarchaeota archaeon]MDW8040245.1 Kae1-associated kinase Bud32 [Nitrososphaerota archaeon]
MDEIKQPLLIKKGAEAHLFLAEWHNKIVILKRRLPKKYRVAALDDQIKTYRTIHESRLMHEAKKAGVPTPTIFFVDVKNSTIIMEFIKGKQLKQLCNEVSEKKRIQLFREVGRLIGKLHKYGIVHGDLTTSNMIQASDGKIFFVDFGLSEKTRELEARGVDLHLMKRALQSTHFRYAEKCFDAIIEGYSNVLGAGEVRNVLDKIREIESRGRYIAERRR